MTNSEYSRNKTPFKKRDYINDSIFGREKSANGIDTDLSIKSFFNKHCLETVVHNNFIVSDENRVEKKRRTFTQSYPLRIDSQ